MPQDTMHAKVVKPIERSEFVKVYFALVILNSLVAVVSAVLFRPVAGELQTGIDPFAILASLLGFAVFVLSIIALVMFIRRKYSRFSWIVPILSILFPIAIMIATSIIVAVTWSSNAEAFMNQNATPEEIAALVPAGLKTLNYISSLISVIIGGLASYSLSRIRQIAVPKTV